MSGNHRGGGHRGSRSGEYRSFSGEPPTGGYRLRGDHLGDLGPADQPARPNEPGAQNTPSAEYSPYPGDQSGPSATYGTRPGDQNTPFGAYGEQGGPSTAYGARSGEHDRHSGEYAGSSGGYDRRSGEDDRRSGEYAGRSGEFEGRSGEYRTRSAEYRARSGSHRVVRERRRGKRFVAVLLGIAAGAGACALAAFVIISGLGGHDRGSTGQVVGSTARTPEAKAEKTAVPDACTLLAPKIADRLAPHAERGPADNYASNDRQNQCVWGVYSGENQRQLSVETRAIAGTQAQSATDAARAAFVSERTADESGKALLGGQQITDKSRVNGLGDEAYVVYSVDKDQASGAAVANVRLANVLVTVHYSGSDGSDALPADDALTAVQDVARSVLESLNQS